MRIRFFAILMSACIGACAAAIGQASAYVHRQVNGNSHVLETELPTRLVRPAIFALSRVMMHDVVSPTVASRYYLYGTLGAYAIMASSQAGMPHPSVLIRHFPAGIGRTLPEADPSLSALFCIYETGMLMLPSGLMLENDYAAVREQCMVMGHGTSAIDAARRRAAAVAREVVDYAKTDGYLRLSSYPRYRPRRREGFWFPTPPGYMEAVEPHWGRMRTVLIDSAGQFPCPPPAAFDTAAGSRFRMLMEEVRRIGSAPVQGQRDIAAFWDCNPFVLATSGHMTLGFKKISPGGHWMNIACLAAEKAGLGFAQTVQLAAFESCTLFDAFIACWAEKYRSDRVRPETVINRYLDVQWQPLLQTPPFPEYTSGHSVISSASAELLSYLVGEGFAYTDDTEVIFELPPRDFTSFRQAAAEASVSRLYGGIHFRDAIEAGQDQGARLGREIVARLRRAGIPPVYGTALSSPVR